MTSLTIIESNSEDSLKQVTHIFEGFNLNLELYNQCLEAVFFSDKDDNLYPVTSDSNFHILTPIGKFGAPVRSHQEMLLIFLDGANFFVQKNEIERFNSVFPFDFLLNSKG